MTKQIAAISRMGLYLQMSGIACGIGICEAISGRLWNALALGLVGTLLAIPATFLRHQITGECK